MSEPTAVIVAAIIAGWVAFFSLIISKEQSVSSFRQQWIDELRKDIAQVVARVTGIHGESVTKSQGEQHTLWLRVKADLSSFNELVARIRLRLNPQESTKKEGPATKEVLASLKELDSIFDSPEPRFDKLEEQLNNLVENAQVILKENWRRVRSGEVVYKISKWVTLGFAIAAVAAALLHLLKVSIHGVQL